ncbi:hypothetical protein [Gordonia alkanivorans]|uniref:hypothetical protein n=1 Tax=Gordonia alkanivorans TaxID=84096 RepID=UPI0024B677E8|nr:hypothetical protein [Gordonia alkanivorans]MDJ0010116.1 hypothetical protein [Gordonia alkanivorans]MDJ0495694.1 hypothetical protein [Gordonia alkanivorans]
MTTYEPMQVTRVHTENGSHIEPPLDQKWSELDKLRWNAGVVIADTGVPLRIKLNDNARYTSNGVDIPVYGLQLGSMSTSRRFHAMWDYLNGVSAGAVEALTIAGDRGQR